MSNSQPHSLRTANPMFGTPSMFRSEVILAVGRTNPILLVRWKRGSVQFPRSPWHLLMVLLLLPGRGEATSVLFFVFLLENIE